MRIVVDMMMNKAKLTIGIAVIAVLAVVLIIGYFEVKRNTSREMQYGELTLLAFNANGNELCYGEFDDIVSGTLLVTTIDDNPVAGRPWLEDIDGQTTIKWNSAKSVQISVAWGSPATGYSTVYLDNDGRGYDSSATINFNFEVAITQWRLFNESYDMRVNSEFPYNPSKQFMGLQSDATRSIGKAQNASSESQRGYYSNKALDEITLAWELMLYEYGMQFGKEYYSPDRFWFGITLATAEGDPGDGDDALEDYELKLDKAKKQGNDWVRILFEDAGEGEDFTFSKEETFEIYDEAIDYANTIGLNVMGQILDSALWPEDITVETYRQRTHNLVTRYQDRISAWEVSNESNGSWLGGDDPISDDIIVDCVNASAREVKEINRSLKTISTLFWWEGTADDDEHPLFLWIEKWKQEKNFGENMDVIALSIYPGENPVGSALDVIIQKTHEIFPDKTIMIGEFDYYVDPHGGYWWHDDDDIKEVQEELCEQFYTAMMGYSYSMNGGFWWYFHDEMIEKDDDGKYIKTDLYDVLKRVISSFKSTVQDELTPCPR